MDNRDAMQHSSKPYKEICVIAALNGKWGNAKLERLKYN